MMNAPIDWTTAGKIDLHRHLEGCIRPHTAFELGQATGAVAREESFERFRERVVVRHPMDLLEVLACFDQIRRPIVGHEAVVRIAREAIEDAAAERVEQCELRYSPLTLAKAAALSLEGVKRAVGEGIAQARAQGAAVEVALTVVLSRRHGVDAAWELVRHIEDDHGECYAGVDFASDELRHRSREFGPVAAALAELGLPLTIHTGEGVGPEYVAEALALPGVRRLGHAVSLVQDPELVAAVAERGVLVEVCPTSNVRTGLVASYREHPAPRLLAAGVRMTFCSDDPALFDITLGQELVLAREEMGLSDAELQRTQQWAREAWFGNTER